MTAVAAVLGSIGAAAPSLHNDPAVIPGAACRPVAALVAGPLLEATVLGVHTAAVLLSVDDPALMTAPAGSRALDGDSRPPVRVVSVLTAEASGVPNGVRTALRAAARPFAHLAPHDPAFVGGGRIQLPGLAVRAVRTIRTGVPTLTLTPGRAALFAAQIEDFLRDEPRGVVVEPVSALREALGSGSAIAVRDAVRALVGLGTGSTPGGDDVLCGSMAALRATGRAVLADQIAAAALPDCDRRTPLLSADLLRLAAAGHVCAEAAAVLRAGGREGGVIDDSSELRGALATLVAIGHTSGADLATGIAIGLGVPDQPAPRRPRHTRRSAAA